MRCNGLKKNNEQKKKIKRKNAFDKTAYLRGGRRGEEGGLIRGH